MTTVAVGPRRLRRALGLVAYRFAGGPYYLEQGGAFQAAVAHDRFGEDQVDRGDMMFDQGAHAIVGRFTIVEQVAQTCADLSRDPPKPSVPTKHARHGPNQACPELTGAEAAAMA